MLLKRLLPYATLFLLIESVVRISLFVRADLDVDFSAYDASLLFLKGLWFDLVTVSFFLIPVTLYYLALPARLHGTQRDIRTDAVLRFVYCFVLLFSAIAEHLFWTEFSTRFNFIAIDYLVYTQEVVGNIIESYPLGWIMTGIGLGAALLCWLSLRFQPLVQSQGSRFYSRVKGFAVVCAAVVGLYVTSYAEQAEFVENAEATELAANGIYNLFQAFSNNEISYNRFYATEPDEQITKNVRTLLDEEDAKFVHSSGKDLTRIIEKHQKEKHKNVILVAMESLSADYMGTFGNTENITPNLDRLYKEGLAFSQLYATGTRTVRGLEAITLSIPPTPGQSILRRPGNDNLFSLGFIFKDRGYDTKFIYGGYGYFDNMNGFFSVNGFDILDRTQMSKEEINFANVWGVCDEDMFTRAIAEADKSYANGKPFMHLIMTTSNHRPFTYPDGRIDLASKSGRHGGVKYADYSVGKLIADAKKKPWFKDTVFIFVADHTAGAGGKAELDPHKYHIPMVFYSPGFIKPGRYEKIASQIDLAPTLLGMLNFSYYTKFYGEDVLHNADENPHAFISNYQKVALIRDNQLVVLAPKKRIDQYSWPQIEAKGIDKPMANDAIAYYQSASWWKDQFKRIPTVAIPQTADIR